MNPHDGSTAQAGDERPRVGAARGWPVGPGLRRPRLLDQLAPAPRSALVLAPAGSGKTTLLAHYATTCPTPVVWHRADHADADADGFATRLGHAVADVTGSAAARAVRGVNALLAAMDDAAGAALTLVVDDAQVILDSGAEGVLEQLLTRGPPMLSIIMASRRRPALNLSRAEIGPLAVITADDLRFRSWEVEQLFRDVYEAPLPPDDIAVLARRTEGWAACLQLFHLSTMSQPLDSRRRAVQALGGGPRCARTYLVRTVLHELPAQLRTFLARTAVFDVLTAQRCDRLLGRTDSQPRLEELEQLAALTTSEDGGVTFRYHEVLRRHLESVLLEELGADGTRAWFTRAATILEADDAPGEALCAYARAERWEDATRLLHSDGARVISTEPAAVWHDLLPAHLVDEDPWLSMAVGRRLAAEGRLRAASQRYHHAEALFPDHADRQRAAGERRLVELWTTGVPKPHLHWMDRVRAAVRRHPAAGLPPASETSAGDQLGAAVAALLSGDVPGAARRLHDAPPDADTDATVWASTRLMHIVNELATGARPNGSLHRLTTDAERIGAVWIARQARVLDGLFTSDGASISRVVAECEAADDVWGALLARAAEALRRLLDGEPALAAWQDLAARSRALDAATLEAWAVSAAALAAAAEGDPEAAAMARTAESFVRASGVWGAQALTVLALAATDPQQRAGSREQALALAAEHGLPWPARLADRLLGTPDRGRPAAVTEVRRLPPVTVRCFGGFSLEVADRTLNWRSLRPRAVCALRLLAARFPQPVHRETLMVLWPDLAPEAVPHSLQVAVSSLRRLLTPDAPRGANRMVERHGDTYVLNLPPGSTVDVAVFAAGLRGAETARRAHDRVGERAALAGVVSCYTGELLPEDGPAEWVVEDRQRLRLQAAQAAGRLATLAMADADLAAGIDAARSSVQIDPFSDSSWRLLITAYERTADAAAAARARQEYRAVLTSLDVPAGPTLWTNGNNAAARPGNGVPRGAGVGGLAVPRPQIGR